MRKFFFLFLVLFLCALPARAQFDLVTGQVLDPGGLAYSNATLKAQLVINGVNVTGQPTVTNSNQAQCISAGLGNAPCQMPFPGSTSVTLDVNGNIPGGGLNLADNPSVTPAGTQWQFSVTISPGVSPPTGTGPQSFAISLTVNSNPFAAGTSLSAAAPALAASGVESGGGGGPGFILAAASGVVANTRYCAGLPASWTAPSTTINCTTANFSSADLTKLEFGSDNCCNLGNFAGNFLAVPQGTITAILTTTSVSVSVASTIACSSSTQCLWYWGTDDTAAWVKVNNLYLGQGAAKNSCPIVIMPAGSSILQQFILTAAALGCIQIQGAGGSGNLPSGGLIGQGADVSVFVIPPGFNYSGCTSIGGGTTSNGGFFAFAGAYVRDVGFTAGWVNNPSGGHVCNFISPGTGSTMLNVKCGGWGANDGTTIGIVEASFSQYKNVWSQGCGHQAAFINVTDHAAWHGGAMGNSQGPCVIMNVTTEFDEGGIYYGQSGATCFQYNGPGLLISKGSLLYQTLALQNFAIGGGHVAFEGFTVIGTAAATDGLFMSGASTVVTAKDSTFTGVTNAINRSSGLFQDLGGNKLTGATTTIRPTCPTVTGATATCAGIAGSTNEKGTLEITVTAAGTASGTVTMNFAGTYTGATGTTPACNFNPANTGTGAWNARASTILSTRSTTAPIISWDNNAVALGNLTWDIDYTCTAR